MLTLEYAYSYGASIHEARRLTEKERESYKPEYADRIFVGIGENVGLEMINIGDIPDRKSDGSFNGCSNAAWIITEEERDALLVLNEKRKKAKAAAERAEEVELLERLVAKCEAQRDLPSREEAARRMKRYNNVNNEGGEGYVPYIYSRDEYEYYKQSLEELKNAGEIGNGK